jgi:hypothetical protein
MSEFEIAVSKMRQGFDLIIVPNGDGYLERNDEAATKEPLDKITVGRIIARDDVRFVEQVGTKSHYALQVKR